jgi:hypothetical protein
MYPVPVMDDPDWLVLARNHDRHAPVARHRGEELAVARG